MLIIHTETTLKVSYLRKDGSDYYFVSLQHNHCILNINYILLQVFTSTFLTGLREQHVGPTRLGANRYKHVSLCSFRKYKLFFQNDMRACVCLRNPLCKQKPRTEFQSKEAYIQQQTS